jgi:hypothetical protein
MNRKAIHLLIASLSLNSLTALAQTGKAPGDGLFENDSVLKITLSGNLRDLMTDKGENPQNHPVAISYLQDGKEISVNAEARTRGHFRKTMEIVPIHPCCFNLQRAMRFRLLYLKTRRN